METLSSLLRTRMVAHANLLRSVTSHTTLVGAGREEAIAILLRELIPRRFEVLSGTIARLDEGGQPMRSRNQLDAVVVDTIDYPVLLRVGASAVVLPQAVRAAVEVKSVVTDATKLREAIAQLSAARVVPEMLGVPLALFAYEATDSPQTLRDWLEAARDHADTQSMFAMGTAAAEPVAPPDFIVFDSGPLAVLNAGFRRYEFFQATPECPSVVLAVSLIAGRMGQAIAEEHGERLASRTSAGFRLLERHLGVELVPADGVPHLELSPASPAKE